MIIMKQVSILIASDICSLPELASTVAAREPRFVLMYQHMIVEAVLAGEYGQADVAFVGTYVIACIIEAIRLRKKES